MPGAARECLPSARCACVRVRRAVLPRRTWFWLPEVESLAGPFAPFYPGSGGLDVVGLK